jgi:hypothetical protein
LKLRTGTQYPKIGRTDQISRLEEISGVKLQLCRNNRTPFAERFDKNTITVDTDINKINYGSRSLLETVFHWANIRKDAVKICKMENKQSGSSQRAA